MTNVREKRNPDYRKKPVMIKFYDENPVIKELSLTLINVLLNYYQADNHGYINREKGPRYAFNRSDEGGVSIQFSQKHIVVKFNVDKVLVNQQDQDKVTEHKGRTVDKFHKAVSFKIRPDHIDDVKDLLKFIKRNEIKNFALNDSIKDALLPFIGSLPKQLPNPYIPPQRDAQSDEAEPYITAEVMKRQGQEKFRKNVSRVWKGKRCAVTGVSYAPLLIASHIVSFAECEDGEHWKGSNGMFLVAHLDALFDKHKMSFVENPEQSGIFRAEFSPDCDRGALKRLHVNETASVDITELEPEARSEFRGFMARHYEEFRNNTSAKNVS